MSKKQKKIFPKILVSGSVVYDTIFRLTTPIRDQIIVSKDKVYNQNMMFSGSEKTVHFGGTGGNIAYGLSILGANPILVSGAGKDFGEYADHLSNRGVDCRVSIDKRAYTSVFYGMTDTKNEQIGVFQANSYYKLIDKNNVSSFFKENELRSISLAIFSPGKAESILRDLKEFNKFADKDAFVIVDPGQMIKIDFTKKILLEAVSLANMLILNEQEAYFMKNIFGVTHEMLFKKGLQYLIVTYGEKGSTLFKKNDSVKISSSKAKKVVDVTGAGDAYRSGLIYEIVCGGSIEDGMKKGSILGASCVESSGGQNYII